MPATAKERGLANPYDPGQALEASASLLADSAGKIRQFWAGGNGLQRWARSGWTLAGTQEQSTV